MNDTFLTPLDEESEAPRLEAFPKGKDPVHRRLQAIAGAGSAYVFAVIPEQGDMSIDFSGFYPEDLASALRQIAVSVEEDV